MGKASGITRARVWDHPNTCHGHSEDECPASAKLRPKGRPKGGPPGARTRHLGIKSPSEDLPLGLGGSRHVAIFQLALLVGNTVQARMALDGTCRDETVG